MAWSLEGSYVENCNCDVLCPCTWSGFGRGATHERCNVLGGFRVERGSIEDLDVSGLYFGFLIDAPKQMTDGNWRLGLLIDENASEQQAAGIQAILSGEMGSPMAMFVPFIGEVLGVERVPVSWHDTDGAVQVRFGEVADVLVEAVRSIEGKDMTVGNVPHPFGPTFTIAASSEARISGFGIAFGAPDTNGLMSRFSWSG